MVLLLGAALSFRVQQSCKWLSSKVHLELINAWYGQRLAAFHDGHSMLDVRSVDEGDLSLTENEYRFESIITQWCAELRKLCVAEVGWYRTKENTSSS